VQEEVDTAYFKVPSWYLPGVKLREMQELDVLSTKFPKCFALHFLISLIVTERQSLL
jgi:hypothetical protein